MAEMTASAATGSVVIGKLTAMLTNKSMHST
jgi:hypothetical protein